MKLKKSFVSKSNALASSTTNKFKSVPGINPLVSEKAKDSFFCKASLTTFTSRHGRKPKKPKKKSYSKLQIFIFWSRFAALKTGHFLLVFLTLLASTEIENEIL